MSVFESDRPRRKLPVFLFLLLVLVVGGLGAAFAFRDRFESQPPEVRITPASETVGLAPLEIAVSDAGTGLKSLSAVLSAGGRDYPLATEQFATPVPGKTVAVDLAKLGGVKEGPAVLRVHARDASWSNFFKGNEVALEKSIAIDVTPPTVELVADDRYINFGGVGAIAYKASADTERSGVKIGQHFFPGVKGLVKDQPERYFALFAHPYDAPADARAAVVATDKAGNTRELRLAYELKNVKYRKSTIALGDAFLQNKVAPLLADVAARQGAPKDVFVAVNKGVRKQNEDRIREITSKVTPALLWKGAFTQLSNSKVEANFADYRTYTYNGEPVDSAYHLGYDLSVTKNYPIEAANAGTVAFTGDLGLYGNAVILDHGLGLFTLYGHMSSIDVKAGDTVQARQVLGKTGETGLAAGDHLHFGVYLDGVAILPVEWWDAKWIGDNIVPKLEGRNSEEIASAAPSHPARKAAGKRKR